jgi:predicted NBD/HSP70 family sugar kinase
MAMQPRTRPIVPFRADHAEIRRNNLEVVLRHLSWRGPTSRAGIASKTGLTRSTVSRLVNELIGLDLVKETTVDRGGAGRPGTRLELDGRSILAVGMEINVDSLTVLVADIGGREVALQRRPYDAGRAGPRRSVTAVCRIYEAILTEVQAASAAPPRIAGVAVAIPGLVDVEAGIVEDAPNLGWQDVDLRALVRAQIPDPNVSISVGNDGNFAALAEYWHGACAGTPNLLYVTGEVGIGGGIIVNGDLLLGSLGRAGEIGHMTVDPHGPQCGCGRQGCWEAFVGLNAFLASIGGRPDGSGTPEDMVRAVAARASRNEPAVIEALKSLGFWVGIGVSNLINVFSPDVVVLGGYFASLSTWLLPTAYDVLLEHLMSAADPRSLLRVSTLGFSAAATGAAIQAVDQVLSNPASLKGR